MTMRHVCKYFLSAHSIVRVPPCKDKKYCVFDPEKNTCLYACEDVSSQKAEEKDSVEKIVLSNNRLANFLFSRVKGLKSAVDYSSSEKDCCQ